MTRSLSLFVYLLAIATTACGPIDEQGEDPIIIVETADSEAPEDVESPDPSVEEPTSTPRNDVIVVPEPAPVADRQPEPDPEPVSGSVCQAKNAPIQLIHSCTFEWSQCGAGGDYAFECRTQNLAGNIFSLCNCFEGGVMDDADKIVDICGLSDWSAVEAVVNESCGWDLR